MAYNFSITEMKKISSLNGISDVVVQVCVKCVNTETTLKATQNIALNCDNVGTNPSFINYNDLTEADVLSWLNTDEMEPLMAILKSKTEAPVAPPQPDPLPWASAN